MERRDFLQHAGMFTALGLLPANGLLAAQTLTTNDPLKPFLLLPTTPLQHNNSMSIRTWVRSAMTGGTYSCVECAVAPKTMGPPPHYHKELDELMFVLEGTAHVIVENEVVEVPAGGWHFRPRLLRHTFWNASDQPLRFVDMYFNQPFEEFLERIFFELTPEKGYPYGSPQRDKEHKLLDEKFGLVYAPTANEERQTIIKKYDLK
jgi:mannose-6-phosphate isomerase-like protein (cupin superfamily)